MADGTGARPIRVVIVDDTRSIRAMIRLMLNRSPKIEVVGEAGDPFEARELIRALNPDVITLDVVMPRMNGLSFLERLMRLRPMPVVMVSTRTTENSSEAIKALSLGAFDCVDIASLARAQSATDLVETVLMAAASNTRLPVFRAAEAEPLAPATLKWNGRVVVIGSSTGGVDALLTVLSTYPADGPPTLIAQHMPPSFLESFALRLNRSTAPEVRLAAHGDRMEPGVVLLAPGGDTHVRLALERPLQIELLPHDGCQTYVPSIDVLMTSAVPHARRMVGVMLTGMGNDGAEAMLGIRLAGGHTIAQDAASSTVDGMPRAVRELGGAVEVASLSDIGQRILDQVSDRQREDAS